VEEKKTMHEFWNTKYANNDTKYAKKETMGDVDLGRMVFLIYATLHGPGSAPSKCVGGQAAPGYI
jgi:hypothetical protein